jgi:hypothetical protein
MTVARPRDISPITILTPVRRIWAWWLWATWPIADRLPWLKRPLHRLSFIHVAHWGLMDRLPAAASRRRALRLPSPYIVFQTNFDGEPEDYVEAFAIKVPGHIHALWQGAYDFPGTRPQATFVKFVLQHAVPGQYHYYSAYPHGTVRTVRSALALEGSFERFRNQVAELDAYEFEDAWRQFLTREQRNL